MVTKIQDPQVKEIVCNDELLMNLATVKPEQQKERRYHDIRYGLSVVAKLLMEFRTITNEEMRVENLQVLIDWY